MQIRKYIKCVNVRRKKPSDMPDTFVYCGRRVMSGGWKASPLQNNNYLEPGKPPGETLEKFRADLRKEYANAISPTRKELLRVAGLVKAAWQAGGNPETTAIQLGCWCDPNPCHTNVIAEAIVKLIEAGRC